jgi:hypothetical protein
VLDLGAQQSTRRLVAQDGGHRGERVVHAEDAALGAQHAGGVQRVQRLHQQEPAVVAGGAAAAAAVRRLLLLLLAAMAAAILLLHQQLMMVVVVASVAVGDQRHGRRWLLTNAGDAAAADAFVPLAGGRCRSDGHLLLLLCLLLLRLLLLLLLLLVMMQSRGVRENFAVILAAQETFLQMGRRGLDDSFSLIDY